MNTLEQLIEKESKLASLMDDIYSARVTLHDLRYSDMSKDDDMYGLINDMLLMAYNRLDSIKDRTKEEIEEVEKNVA